MKKDYSILIGGAAGEGSKKAGLVIAKLMNEHGYRVFIHEDYQSLIKGGHNFSLIRASDEEADAVKEKVDFLLALNEDTLKRHITKLEEEGVLIYNADNTENKNGVGIPLTDIVSKAQGIPIMKNTALVASFAKIVGMSWEKTEKVLRRELPIETEGNLRVAKEAYDRVESVTSVEDLEKDPLPIISGNEAVALGAIKAGVSDYFAYPMTPSTGILHFLSGVEGVSALQLESELSAASAALGCAYTGRKTMIGTSGGGFALMSESLSFSAQAEVPFVVVLSQRMGPGTGVPTYTAQGDLLFSLFAGHGDMCRFVVAPGDAKEAFHLSAEAVNVSWEYRMPAVILIDKELSENSYTFNQPDVRVFDGQKNFLGKVTGYEHDKQGVSTENEEEVVSGHQRRMEKYESLRKKVEDMDSVKVYGEGENVLLVWGSNKGVALEAARNLNLRVVQVLVFQPFPEERFRKAIKGAKKIISVETNASGQGSFIMRAYGAQIDEEIKKYDGRPFTVEELYQKLKKAL